MVKLKGQSYVKVCKQMPLGRRTEYKPLTHLYLSFNFLLLGQMFRVVN